MCRNPLILFLFFLMFTGYAGHSQDTVNRVADTLSFSGQLSVWGNYNFRNELPLQSGGHYIPVLDYGILFPGNRKLDFEGSADLYGFLAIHPFDTVHADGNISPYRAWMRFSTRQLEIRMGLQKINFGSATLLRPLMWFDQIDPRDPLQITKGVWGLLVRYYFLNNANFWLWGLYQNTRARPWDIGTTQEKFPELGARVQSPVPKGEIAFSYHFRMADTRELGAGVPADPDVPENRIGLDAKWDLGAGIWFEGAWINKSKITGLLTNQEIFNIGADNTFKAGNGLTVMIEQLLASTDEHAFAFSNTITFTALSLNYPPGLADNLGAIFYYDWKNHSAYNFVNWNHRFRYLSLYVMAYWNPEKYDLPQQRNAGYAYAGPGAQVMLVYHH